MGTGSFLGCSIRLESLNLPRRPFFPEGKTSRRYPIPPQGEEVISPRSRKFWRVNGLDPVRCVAASVLL